MKTNSVIVLGLSLLILMDVAAQSASGRTGAVFRVHGECGLGLSSADGVTWLPHPAGGLSSWRSSAAGNGLTVAIDHHGQIQSSVDGVNWIVRDGATASA